MAEAEARARYSNSNRPKEVGGADRKGTGPGGNSNNTGWQSIVHDHLATVRAERAMAQQIVDGRTGIDYESTWVRKVGSAKHLAGKDLLKLWGASAGPISRSAREKMRDKQARKQQEKMALVADSFDRKVSRCRARLELVPDEALA